MYVKMWVTTRLQSNISSLIVVNKQLLRLDGMEEYVHPV